MLASEREELRSLLYRALEGVGGAVDIRLMSEDAFEESKDVVGGIAYPAAREGVVLHPHSG